MRGGVCMKKFLFIILAVLLLPAALGAQTVLPGREGKIMAMGDFLSRMLTQQANKYARAADIQAVALQQTQKAVSSLQALKKAYPEYGVLISSVIDSHEQVVETAAKQAGKEIVLNELTVHLAVLNKDVSVLRRKNEEVAEQVKQIVAHEYWVACIKEAVSMDKMKDVLAQRLKNISASAEKPSGWLAEL